MKSIFNFDLKQINSFLTIIDEGSFTQTARKLKLGQATISHHINQLEEVLGVSLFDRSGKIIKLTDKGELFENFCRNLFLEIDKLKTDLNRSDATEAAVIASSTIPADYIIPDVISKLRIKDSNLHFKIDVSDSREVIEKVKDKSVDIGIIGQNINNRSIESVKIFDDEIVLICSGFKEEITDFEQEDFIIRRKGSGTRKAWEKALSSSGIYPSSLNNVYECSTTEGIKKAVLSGIGIAFVSKLAITDELKSGTLKIIRLKNITITRDFYLIFLRKRGYRSIPVMSLINAFKNLRFSETD